MAAFVSCGSGGVLDSPSCTLDACTTVSPLQAATPCCPSYLQNAGDANDVVLVSSSSTKFACSDFMVKFSVVKKSSLVRLRLLNEKNNLTASLENGIYLEGFDMVSSRRDNNDGCLVFEEGQSTKPTIQALQQLSNKLQPGKNPAQYVQFDARGEVVGVVQFDIYKWDGTHRVVVMDIDGTITKSNVRGVLDTIVFERHAYAHDGICKFLSQLVGCSNTTNIRILYLTARPMSLAQSTRDFLQNLQQDSTKLPEGPLFCNPHHLGQVLFSELISKTVHNYKADVLLRQIVLPFAAVREESPQNNVYPNNNSHDNTSNVIMAGFGNSSADAMAYEMAGVARQHIYLIDKQSNISCIDKDAHDKEVTRIPSSRTNMTSPSSSSSIEMTNSDSFRRRKSQQEENNNETRTMKMKAIRKRRSYRRLIGTTFCGYHDSRLLPSLQQLGQQEQQAVNDERNSVC